MAGRDETQNRNLGTIPQAPQKRPKLVDRILDVLLKVLRFDVELSTQSICVGKIMGSICCDYHAEHSAILARHSWTGFLQQCRDAELAIWYTHDSCECMCWWFEAVPWLVAERLGPGDRRVCLRVNDTSVPAKIVPREFGRCVHVPEEMCGQCSV